MDDGEDVVKIVRHAAGQLADGFHFLRLAQLLAQLAAFGDVHNDAANLDQLAVGIRNDFALFTHVAFLAARENDAMFEIEGLAAFQGVTDGGGNARAVIGVNGTKEAIGGHRNLAGFEAEDAEGFVRPAEFVGVDVLQIFEIEFPTAEMSDALGGGEAGFAFFQRLAARLRSVTS